MHTEILCDKNYFINNFERQKFYYHICKYLTKNDLAEYVVLINRNPITIDRLNSLQVIVLG